MKHKFVIEIETKTKEEHASSDNYFMNVLFMELHKVIPVAYEKDGEIVLQGIHITKES